MAADDKDQTPTEKARDLSAIALGYAPMFGPLGEIAAVIVHDLLDEQTKKENNGPTKDTPCRKD